MYDHGSMHFGTNVEFVGPITRRRGRPRLTKAPAPPAVWQKIVGDLSGTTIQDRQRRAGGLRKLFSAVENLFKQELRLSSLPSPLWGEGSGVRGRGASGDSAHGKVAGDAHDPSSAALRAAPSPQRGEGGDSPASLHTFLWDPTRNVCALLGIAHAKLSALMKELTGMAAHEIVDRLRAKNVRTQLRADLREFVHHEFGLAGEGQMPRERSEVRWLMWKRLRATRSERHGVIEVAPKNAPAVTRKKVHLENNLPDQLFDRTAWAIRHGFPNYARFRRACLLYYNQTPQQLEWELIDEIAKYYAAAESLRRRNVASVYGASDGGPNCNRAAAVYGEVIDAPPEKPYRDLWSAYKAFQPEWLAAMADEFGLSGFVRDDE